MLRDAAVDILMGRLGKRTSAITQQDIINEMVMTQETTLEGSPTPYWFLLSENSDALTTAADERLSLPADFLLEWEDGALYVVNSDASETALVREDWDVVVKDQGSASGQPKYYDIAGEYFLFRPIPDDTYTIKTRYYQRQADLSGAYGDSNNIENGWLKYASDLFISEVGIVIANQYLQSDKMVQLFLTQATAARKRLVDLDTIIKETNKQRFMEG